MKMQPLHIREYAVKDVGMQKEKNVNADAEEPIMEKDPKGSRRII
jgi:hypothetical protein